MRIDFILLHKIRWCNNKFYKLSKLTGRFNNLQLRCRVLLSPLSILCAATTLYTNMAIARNDMTACVNALWKITHHKNEEFFGIKSTQFFLGVWLTQVPIANGIRPSLPVAKPYWFDILKIFWKTAWPFLNICGIWVLHQRSKWNIITNGKFHAPADRAKITKFLPNYQITNFQKSFFILLFEWKLEFTNMYNINPKTTVLFTSPDVGFWL